MDPLSLATGVLTFIGACNALTSTIKKLHNLRKAPKELKDLENEISALLSCTKDVNQLLVTHSGDRFGLLRQVSIKERIEYAHKKIEDTHDFLKRTLLDASTSSRIRSSAWLKWQSEFDRLHQDLRDTRSEIGMCISLFTA